MCLGLGVRAGVPNAVDVCVYGATPSGVVAAITAKQEGKTVLLIEPSRWVGGILGAGLKPKQDCPDPSVIGGLTKTKVFTLGDNPPAIRAAMLAWLKAEGVPVLFEYRVTEVKKDGAKIAAITVIYTPPDRLGVPMGEPESTAPRREVAARVFIDASYEGDVMALARVPYAIGRESSATFNESPAGMNKPTNWSPIDPWVQPGVPTSGLLPLVEMDHKKALGAADDYSQAYNFRFYVTTDPLKRAPFERPPGYAPEQFELVGRFVEYLKHKYQDNPAELTKQLAGIFPGWLNTGDYNYQRSSLVTIAPLGRSRFYQDGSWTERAKVWREHIDYLSGLHYFLSTDPRVPAEFRTRTRELGLDRTMHPETSGWPNQLYVRIARRMKGEYVLTHADVKNEIAPPQDAVGLGLYGVDIYPVRRIAVANPETGQMGIATEGNMFIGGSRGTGVPYAVPYRAIVPRAEDCGNLLVPVCFSASYIAYASARMEPTYCVLGESAGVAAVQSIEESVPVQKVDISKLHERLIRRGQVLSWSPKATAR